MWNGGKKTRVSHTLKFSGVFGGKSQTICGWKGMLRSDNQMETASMIFSLSDTPTCKNCMKLLKDHKG